MFSLSSEGREKEAELLVKPDTILSPFLAVDTALDTLKQLPNNEQEACLGPALLAPAQSILVRYFTHQKEHRFHMETKLVLAAHS